MTAISDDFEFQPLANIMRGIGSDDTEPADDQLIAELTERGLDVEETISQVESRISAFLQRPRVASSRYTRAKWKHPSVQLFAAGDDPVAKMMSVASDLALRGLERTVDRTSVDPFLLAELKGISVVPNENILDARLVPLGTNRLRIEYNPIQPRTRVRFSIAHELSHTFFPDCQDTIRNRAPRASLGPHEWELEMLCNIGAAELLMPIANFPTLTHDMFGIDKLLELKETFEVSSEALISRVARLTHEPCSMFAASRIETGDLTGRYRVDYAIPSRAWTGNRIDILPKNTTLNDCTAIGFTAKQDETWPGIGEVHIECVGVPPYTGSSYPRIVGLIRRVDERSLSGIRILYVKGDATQPRGAGPRVIAHVVNDKAASWGTGFARAIATKWPTAQTNFREWTMNDRAAFRLGNTFHTSVAENLWTFQMVCQHGYGPSPLPRIRYGALKACLDSLAIFARELNATVHMPRLGSGQGHAVSSIVSELVDAALCSAGIPVTVYDLPHARQDESMELPGLFSTK